MNTVAFEDRQGGFVFLPVRHGLYVRVPRCVVEVPCRHCNAPAGELCKGSRGPVSDVHYQRRDDCVALRRAGKLPKGRANDIIDSSDDPIVRVEQADERAVRSADRAARLAEQLSQAKDELARCRADLDAARRVLHGAQESGTAAVLARQQMSEEAACVRMEHARLRDEVDSCLRMTLRVGDWESIPAITPLQCAIRNTAASLNRVLREAGELKSCVHQHLLSDKPGIPTADEAKAAIERAASVLRAHALLPGERESCEG